MWLERLRLRAVSHWRWETDHLFGVRSPTLKSLTQKNGQEKRGKKMDASQFLLGSNFNFVGPLHLSSPFSLQKPFWAASHAALLQKNSLLERVLMMNLRSEENRKSSPDLELVAIVLHRGFVNGWKGGQTLPTSLRRQCPVLWSAVAQGLQHLFGRNAVTSARKDTLPHSEFHSESECCQIVANYANCTFHAILL